MAKSKTMTVTNNVQYCLKTLKKAADALPPGEQRDEARKAIKYLMETAEGKTQIRRGGDCNWGRIIPTWELEKTHKFYKPKPKK